jgi:hypothetical protein
MSPPEHSRFVSDLDSVLAGVREMLIEKNRKYGDSALNPVRLMSRASVREQILVRIDDKFSRIMRGSGEEDEDVERDLLGYFLLLRIARMREQNDNSIPPPRANTKTVTP